MFTMALSLAIIVFCLIMRGSFMMCNRNDVNAKLDKLFRQSFHGEIQPRMFNLLCESNDVYRALVFRSKNGYVLSYEMLGGSCFCIQAGGQLLRFPDARIRDRILSPQGAIILYDRADRSKGHSEAILGWRHVDIGNWDLNTNTMSGISIPALQ